MEWTAGSNQGVPPSVSSRCEPRTSSTRRIAVEGPVLNGKLPTGSYFHYLHHRYFECNYGEATLPLDKLFGTFHDGLPAGVGAKLPEGPDR